MVVTVCVEIYEEVIVFVIVEVSVVVVGTRTVSAEVTVCDTVLVTNEVM